MPSRVPTTQDGLLTIREFQPGDERPFRTLNELWIQRYFRIEPKDEEILSDPKGRIIDKGGRIFLAVLNGQTVGCCALIYRTDAEFEIAKTAVTEKQQGRGIGRVLLSAVIDNAKLAGARRLYLETNDRLRPAIRLYGSLGFREFHSGSATSSSYERVNVLMERLFE